MISAGEADEVTNAFLNGNNMGSYNYYISNVNGRRESTSTSYGDKNHNGKTKEMYRIDREMSNITKELNAYENSLKKPIADIARKIREIERKGNDYESWNETYGTFVSLKKEQIGAITAKAKTISDKFKLMQSQVKIEKESGVSLGATGASGIPQADLFSMVKGNKFKGKSQASLVTNPNIAHSNNAIPVDQPKSADRSKIHSILDSLDDNCNAYAMALTKYGESLLSETYIVDPDLGIGYIQYKTPDGDVGIKDCPLNNILQPVNYDNETLTDSTGKVYPIKTTNEMPESIKEFWSDILEENGHYKYGIKQ